MKINIKILNGHEASLEVSETDPVLAVKRLVAQDMGVPVEGQMLVFKGKTLTDNCCLHDYNIREGDKLHLFVKKTTETKPQASGTDFWYQLRTLLSKHFSDSDVEKVLQKYREDFNIWVKQLSLDDIERMAKVHVNEQIFNQ